MPIRKIYHFMQIVSDFEEATAAYTAVFSPQVVMAKSWSDFDKRWASLAVWGPDFVMEIMEPSKDPADGQSPLPKFYGRHGDHLHSLSWFIDEHDFRDYARRMQDGGIRVLLPYATLEEAQTFFTHPKDTFGQLEFQSWNAGDKLGHAPHAETGWTGAYWRDEHPLGLLGMSHMTTIVADLEKAKAFYEKFLDAPAFHEETTADRTSAYVLVGDDTVVELAQPTDADSAIGRDLAGHGELPHAMAFRVKDLDAAAKHIESTGIGHTRDGDTITLDPARMSNALVSFTTRKLPKDPRL